MDLGSQDSCQKGAMFILSQRSAGLTQTSWTRIPYIGTWAMVLTFLGPDHIPNTSTFLCCVQDIITKQFDARRHRTTLAVGSGGWVGEEFAQPSVVRLSSEESSWVRARSPPSHEEQGRQHIILILHDGDDGDWRPLDRA